MGKFGDDALATCERRSGIAEDALLPQVELVLTYPLNRRRRIRRRQFIAGLGGAAAWPMVARAQQRIRTRVIGILMGVADDEEGHARVAAFREELATLGWVPGTNIAIEERWGGGEMDRIRRHAAELATLKPDVVLVNGIRALTTMHAETTTIPIDVVGLGAFTTFAESMAHPGGNVTGFTIFELSMVGKLVETLKHIAPRTARVALLLHPDNDSSSRVRNTFEDVAPSLGVEPVSMWVRDPAQMSNAIALFAREPNGALLLAPDVFFASHRGLISSLAAQHQLPAIYPYRYFATSGGLMSYGTDLLDLERRAAGYVSRILKGERPADLPVQAPVKFELVINLKAAKGLGLDIPPELLARADEVIE